MVAIAGNVIELRCAMAPLNTADAPAVVATLQGDPLLRSAAAVLRGLLRSGQFDGEIFPVQCEVAQRLGRRLDFDGRFTTGLGQLYARWDGKGIPAVPGERLMPAVRVGDAGAGALTQYRIGGWETLVQTARSRSGAQYDPHLVTLLLSLGPGLLADLPTRWDQVLALDLADAGVLM